jgi:hypothetical protein
MKRIREQRAFELLQAREEKKNDNLTLGYRAMNKEQRVRNKKDAEILMNHLTQDQLLKKGAAEKEGDKEELPMDG